MTSKMIGSPSTQATRRKTWGALRASAVGLSMVLANAAWAAPTVVFVATDQADTVVGQDLWRYDYTITGPGDAFGLLNLLFDYTKYTSLASLTVDPALSLLPDVQPDTGAGTQADGIVQVSLDIGLTAGQTAAFSVDFVWLGGLTAPGAQPFEYVDAAFKTEVGRTSPQNGGGSVPEPSALLLAATALLALSARRERGAGA